ncbi:MAG: type II secretion system F family protein, partial [Candidatus Micrarchaeota archaeon]
MPTPRADREKYSQGKSKFSAVTGAGDTKGTSSGRKPPAPSSLYKDSLLKKRAGDKTVAAAEAEAREKARKPFFVSFTKSFSRMFPGMGRGTAFTPEMADAISFLGWDITAEEYYAAYKSIFLVGVILGAVAGGTLYFVLQSYLGIDQMIAMAVAAACVLAPLGFAFVYSKMPFSAVEREKMMALAYVPEIINYLTMSLRLNPNLEKAVEYAAAHGSGKLAEEFNKMVWDIQIGQYLSVEEALDAMAYRWGAYNEDFKHALMLLRASVLEPDRPQREKMLEQASADVVEGTREKMDLYARKLHQPTVYLYYFGILLPLLLAIILPLGGSMSGMQLAKPEYIFAAYCFVIPLGVWLFGKNILAGRPPTYVPPDIPRDFPGVKINGGLKVLAIVLLLALPALGYLTDQGETQGWVNVVAVPLNGALKGVLGDSFLFPGMNENSEFVISGTLGSIEAWQNREEEIAKLPHLGTLPFLGDVYKDYGLFVGLFTIFGCLIAIAVSVSLWLRAEYADRKRAQDEIRSMETEFQDALYVLASRMGENKPVEEALHSAVQFLPKSKVAHDVFARVLDNITTMGMTLDAAIFDETFGAMRNLPSRVIASGMRFLADSVELGVNVAARSLITLSLQMRNAKKIDESLKRLLEDVTTMLKTMATFVAPIVLAVVSAMQKMILSSIAQSGANAAE